jgi:hypothetical protein
LRIVLPEDWQQPRPTLTDAGHIAYVADPANSTVIPVALDHGSVEAAFTLDAVPTSIIAVGTGSSHDH